MRKSAHDYFEERSENDPEFAELRRQTKEIGKVAGKIVTLRSNAGLSAEDLAEKSGVDIQVIEQLEDFEALPSSKDLEKIARALNQKILIHYDIEITPVTH